MSKEAEQPAPVQQCMDHGECFGGKCIYPAPQPAQRKPLTDEEIQTIAFEAVKYNWDWLRFARAIEAAHNIKGDA